MRNSLLMVGVTVLLAVSTAGATITEEALLDSLQRSAFLYFWNEANPTTGLVKDRSTTWSPCSIASLGFGMTAVCVGIDHGWVSRTDGRARILAALHTLWEKPQGSGTSGFIGYKGLYYHFIDMATGARVWSSELSTIDTALLFAGILYCREYFDTADSLDVEVRALSDSITQRADWEFMRNSGSGIRMGWKPETGFSGFGNWIGYNEAMILYIIALGSPTHPVPASTWTYWTSGYSWQTWYGQSYVAFPPLFGHHYSHCWIDFRCIQDAYMQTRGITYFENSRRATLAQRAYCIANPGGFLAYGDSLWGLTAGDGPDGYEARGAPPAQNDDGTITPTAAASSIPFAPEVCIPAVRNMYNALHSQLWTPYGFRDGFNIDRAWWGPDVIGIDQGPIILMIENHRTGNVWESFMQNADIQLGLQRAGFQTTMTDVASEAGEPAKGLSLFPSAPNPFRDGTAIRFLLPSRSHVRLTVYDVSGREVARLVDDEQAAGPHEVRLDGAGLTSGVYYYRLQTEDATITKRCVLLR